MESGGCLYWNTRGQFEGKPVLSGSECSLNRINVYSLHVRSKAWQDILRIAGSGKAGLLKDALASLPDVEVQFFLRQLTLCCTSN